MIPQAIRDEIVNFARHTLGIDLIGICSAEPLQTHAAFTGWVEKGYHAGMQYLARYVRERRDLNAVLPGAQSAIVIGVDYRSPRSPTEVQPPFVAEYARYRDYHKTIKRILQRIGTHLEELLRGTKLRWRAICDTAPVLERELAQRAGIGWMGKNCMSINTRHGSYFLIGSLITNLLLPTDLPAVDRCGTCTRCLEACPTGAFVQPHVLDAKKCIAYWTIEHRGEFDVTTPSLHGWAFGCDVCQAVCPWNRKAPYASGILGSPLSLVDSGEWVQAAQSGKEAALHGTALMRAGIPALRRNLAAIADTCNSH